MTTKITAVRVNRTIVEIFYGAEPSALIECFTAFEAARLARELREAAGLRTVLSDR